MTRLPIPGSDDGSWGTILNDFLTVEHNADGTLKTGGSVAGKVNKAGDTMTGALTLPGDPTSGLHATTKSYVDTTVASGTPDADATTKGKIQLTGDLSGTAASPQIAAGAIVNADINASAAIAKTKLAGLDIVNADVNASAAIDQSKISGLTTALGNKQDSDADLTAIAGLSPTNDDVIQRKSGAWTNRTMAQVKTDLSLTKSDVGLGNVDNTSDANKPVSTATQTALNLKAPLASPTFTGTVTLPAPGGTATSAARLQDTYTEVGVNAQTGTTYTFVLADAGKLVTASNASAQTYSIPTNATAAFPIGTRIDLVAISAGQVTVNAVTPGTTTVQSTGGTSTAPKLRVQFSGATLVKTAVDNWIVFGDLT